MKIGFVLPRYGAHVRGGAENAARALAERLAGLEGWSCDVFTTCAVDATTWADSYPPGTTVEADVTVHRFASDSGRVPDFDARSQPVLAAPANVSEADAQRWIEWQGPVCHAAIDAARDSDCDLVTFHPYLYWPTVAGVAALGDRAVLHPATHDERPIYLSPFRRVFAGATGLAFWTDEERDVALRIFPEVASTPQCVTGVGVEAGNGDATAARAQFGLGDRPVWLYLGRVDRGKGTDMLARYFAEWKARHPGPGVLVFAGQVVHPPPAHPDIVTTGVVDEVTKWGLMRAAEVFVLPSAFESLSLVLLDAWSVGAAALVNGACDVTRNHCVRSGGGLWFSGYGTFEAAADRLRAEPSLRAELGSAGQAYVEARFTWPAVLDRYTAFLAACARRTVHA